MQKILITDTLFVDANQEQCLRKAGFTVERLPKLIATEAELIDSLQDKVGYILGGMEQVTAPVIASTTMLRAVVHCGSAYKVFIPAWREAMTKGIAIATVPNGHDQAVAEWAYAAALAMNRGFLSGQAHTGVTLPGLEDQTVGIIGLGRIGKRIAQMLQASNTSQILYTSRTRRKALEAPLSLTFTPIDEIIHKADVLFLCVSSDVGTDFFTHNQLKAMKNNALLVSFMTPGVINEEDLFQELQKGRIRAVSDYPMSRKFTTLSPWVWHSNDISQAFNTTAGITKTGASAVNSLISLLTQGHDLHEIKE